MIIDAGICILAPVQVVPSSLRDLAATGCQHHLLDHLQEDLRIIGVGAVLQSEVEDGPSLVEIAANKKY